MAVKDPKAVKDPNKPKAEKYPITQLVIDSAYTKSFKSGKTGFFGKGIDPATGQKYQIVGAVKIG